MTQCYYTGITMKLKRHVNSWSLWLGLVCLTHVSKKCVLVFFNHDLCQLKTVIGFSHLHPRRHTIHTYSFTADGAQLIVQCEGGGVYLALQEKYCGTKTTVWNIWILIYLQINNYWYEACLWGRTTQHKSILAFFFFFKDTVVKKSQDQAVVLTCKLWRTEGEIFFWSFS